MKKLLLTSNGFYTEEIKWQFKHLIGEKSNQSKAVIITTASPKKEKNRFAIKAREDLLALGIPQVDFLDIEWNDPEILCKYEVIYLSGGNPFRLLHFLKESGAADLMKNLAEMDKIIVGASAGAIVLGPHIKMVSCFTPELNDTPLQDYTALHLTEELIFPHYNREDLFPDSQGRTIEERLRTFEAINKCKVNRLKDEDYFVFTE